MDLTNYSNQSSTKYINNLMTGAPLLTLTWGSLVNLLKTILVDGFNEQSATSIEADSTGLQVTINFSGNPGFLINQVITISGASDENLNKDHRVLYADGTKLIVRVDVPVVTPISGDIKVKTAPLGYELVYNDITNTGIACFKNKSVKNPGILKVIDAVPPNGYDANWSRYARVVAGTDVDSKGEFINNIKFPRHSQYPNMEKTGNEVQGGNGIHGLMKWDYGLYQYHGYYYSESAGPNGPYPTNWRVIGDDKTFYLMIGAMGANYPYNMLSFGSYNSGASGGNLILTGSQRDLNASTQNNGKSGVAWRMAFTHSGHSVGNVIFKDASGNYHPFLNFRLIGLYTDEGQRQWPSRGGTSSIDPITGKIFTTPLFIKDDPGYIRGTLRGIEQFYGIGKLPDMMVLNTNRAIVLETKMFNWDWDSSESNPYLYSLEDWPEE